MIKKNLFLLCLFAITPAVTCNASNCAQENIHDRLTQQNGDENISDLVAVTIATLYSCYINLELEAAIKDVILHKRYSREEFCKRFANNSSFFDTSDDANSFCQENSIRASSFSKIKKTIETRSKDLLELFASDTECHSHYRNKPDCLYLSPQESIDTRYSFVQKLEQASNQEEGFQAFDALCKKYSSPHWKKLSENEKLQNFQEFWHRKTNANELHYYDLTDLVMSRSTLTDTYAIKEKANSIKNEITSLAMMVSETYAENNYYRLENDNNCDCSSDDCC